jgi:hypothetical protein
MSVAFGLYDPGTAPPTSAWCAAMTTQAKCTPSWNTGFATFQSESWLPPVYGSLWRTTSPSFTLSANACAIARMPGVVA